MHTDKPVKDLTVLEHFYLYAPEPDKATIDMHYKQDMQANPHNDSYKSPRRSEQEIIADWKYQWAITMIQRFNKNQMEQGRNF